MNRHRKPPKLPRLRTTGTIIYTATGRFSSPITTGGVVTIDMFKDDIAYTFGLLRAAAKTADASGDFQRGKELRSTAREVARDFRDYNVEDIPTKLAELRKIRENNLR